MSAIEAAGEPRGRDAHERLGELDGRLVREAGEDHVLQPIELRAHRGVDARVGVAEQVHPPGADGIEVALAVEILEPDAFAAPDRDQRQLLVVLHLRARMPDVREIARDVGGVVFGSSVHGAGSWARC